MKRLAKMFAVTCVAALALAVSAAGASAATFTASATGEVTGTQTTNQVFTVSSNNAVTCKKAHVYGKIEKTADTQQHVTVTYSECTFTIFGWGTSPATVSNATIQFTANSEVHLKNSVTISVPSLGCKTIVEPQSLKGVEFTNVSGNTKVEIHFKVTGLVSKGEGFCPGSSTGTYSGSVLVERVGGGTVSWDK